MEDDLKLPSFRGWFGGIYFRPGGEPLPPALRKGSCDKFLPRVHSESNLESELAFEVAYVPDGFVERGPPGLTRCTDGSAVQFGRGWDYVGGDLSLSIDIGSKAGSPVATITDVPRDRASAGFVNGRASVFIQPATPEGFGNSFIFFKSDDETVLYSIGGINLPFDEMLRIAEGVEFR